MVVSFVPLLLSLAVSKQYLFCCAGRKCKLYTCQNISDLVVKEGIDLQQLSSQAVNWAHVEVFDDTTFESRNPEQWVPRIPGIPTSQAKVALLRMDGTLSWVESTVLDYERNTNRYLVQPHTTQQPPSTAGQAHKAAAGTAAPPVPFWVPRVQLCFSAEDLELYAKRFAAAVSGLAAANVQMAYQLCIDSMPIDNVPQLTTEQVNRVLNFALNSKKLKDRLMDTSSLINEANLEHARAINKSTLHALAAAAASISAAAGAAAAGQNGHFDHAAASWGYAAAAAGAAIREQLLPLVLPPPKPAKPVPHTGTMPLPPERNFKQQLSEFAFKTLLTKPEVIYALSKIRLESSKVGRRERVSRYITYMNVQCMALQPLV
eukprot:GHRR01030336.1.p1 GENE.GHRR01030336.1~~GHRR01030336.1.p1  ORF type:complete len:375 (+),score=131.41 GHRR01030336.1:177-1301(+)